MKQGSYLDGSIRWLGKVRMIRLSALAFPPRREGRHQPVARLQHLLKTQVPLSQIPGRCAVSGLTIKSHGTRFLMTLANDINTSADKALMMQVYAY